MPTIVGVSFRPVTKVYYFDPARFLDLRPGEYVVVDTARGREVGCVSLPPGDMPASEVSGGLKQVVRRATAWDMVERELYRQREAEALTRARQQATEHRLPIKVVRTEYNFDGGRLVIYFTADKRVDFRALSSAVVSRCGRLACVTRPNSWMVWANAVGACAVHPGCVSSRRFRSRWRNRKICR